MNWLDAIVEILTPFILCFIAYPILERFFWFRKFEFAEKVLASFVVSLTLILFPLYIVGVVLGDFFVESSRFIFVTGVVLILGKLINESVKLVRAHEFKAKVKRTLKMEISLINFALVISIIFFVAKYTFFLFIKAIIDWDVSSQYLPLARSIFTQNAIPLSSHGFNNIGQQGISVLYSFVYSNSSSLLAENFRLMPLVFVLIIFLLVFCLSKQFVNMSVAKLALIVCCFLPIFDDSLSWFSFYPDFAFGALAVALFYFLFRYIKTGEIVFSVLAGLSFGLSSFMKPMSFWLFPVILLVFLPLISKRIIRIIITILMPFAILLGALPLSFVGESLSSVVFWSRLSSIFAYSRLPYLFSIFLLTFLIIFFIELSAKTFGHGLKKETLKSLLCFFGIAIPFFLIWYLRNYFEFGTFIWGATVNNPDYQWGLSIIQSIQSTPNPVPGDFYLFNLLILITLPALGITFLMPKLTGAFKLIRDNKATAMLYIWPFGYFLMYFLFADFNVNERYLLPIVPFIAIFSAVGIFYIVKYFKKSPSDNLMVMLCMFLGLFLTVQSLLLHDFQGSLDIYTNSLLQIITLLNIPQNILAGSGLTLTNLGASTASLLYFGIVISAIAVLILLFLRVDANKLKCFRGHVLRIPLKRFLLFGFVLLLALLALVVPYVSLAVNFSGGDLNSFQSKERLKYGFGNLYSAVLPYLEANASKNDVILSVSTYSTGLQYYLPYSNITDLSFPEGLVTMRSVLELDNGSKAFSAMQSANVKYVIVPHNVAEIVPFLSNFMEPILYSKSFQVYDTSTNSSYSLYFKPVVYGSWTLYELQVQD
jgi:hypothetical protein